MSGWTSALLSTGLIVAAGVLALLLATRSLPRPARNTVYRRTAWILVGAAGAPMALVLTAELVGPFVIGAVMLIAAVLARWRRLDHIIAISASLLAVLLVAGTLTDSVGGAHSRGWIVGVLTFEISGPAMTVAAARLGRIVARRTGWRSRGISAPTSV